jgi:predicted transposase/invertase (TIGR01784 family)
MSDPIIMKSFLNALLEGDVEKITSVTFENVEMPRDAINQRGVTFDLHCTTETGDSILIEMQNSYQKFFKTRANFYIFNLMSKKIRRGIEWGKMENDITRIIGIFIMGDGLAGLNDAITCTAECNVKTGEIFWDRHRKYFINLPKFKFDAENITTKDIWINFFKNLGDMDNIHQSVYERADEGLLRLLEKAKVAALTDEERDVYEASMKRLEDEVDMEELGYKIGMEKGMEEGMEKGKEIGREEGERNKSIQIATGMKQEGLDSALIAKLTNLTLEEIEKL